MTASPTARSLGLLSCHHCHLLLRTPPAFDSLHCPRCSGPVHSRKPGSLGTTWALLIAAAVLYVPAMTLPVMTFEYLGQREPQTILSGVVHLFLDGEILIATLILAASVLVPLWKIFGLVDLLIAVHRKNTRGLRRRTIRYSRIEQYGRWSMLDVFVVALLVALVNLDALATIEPGLGATAFAGVVVLTMFASARFDPRLLWDAVETK